MSRNKFILLGIILAGLYYFLPDEGIYRVIKMNAIASLPYVFAGLMIYLLITISLLKRSWKRLDHQLADENVVHFSKIMNRSFDVVRLLGGPNLIELYNKVNFAASVSIDSKRILYDSMRRKRLDIAPPR